MKRFFIVLACIFAVVSFVSCDKNGKGDGPDADGKVTWESLVAEYPFLGNFPKFDGEIEMHQHNVIMGIESVAFFDYKCDVSVSTKYYSKLVAAGFTKNEYAEIYDKVISGKEYTFTGGYSGGSFALSFSCYSK